MFIYFYIFLNIILLTGPPLNKNINGVSFVKVLIVSLILENNEKNNAVLVKGCLNLSTLIYPLRNVKLKVDLGYICYLIKSKKIIL